MESDSIVADDQSYGTSSRSIGSIAAAHGSSMSLNSTVSNIVVAPQSYLIPPLSHSGLSESFMSYSSLSRAGAAQATTDSDDEIPGNVDERRVYRATQEAGQHAFGVVAVDVWILDHGNFVHVPGGFWVNPVFAKRHPSDALERIVNPNHLHYSPPLPQVPGAGLAGYFWALGTDTMIWRDLKAITSDPFQPPYQRMNVLEEAGFGKATGIPFDILGHKGVVIYLTRENASESLLSDPMNANYLKVASQHIGTASAITRPRLLSMNARELRITKKLRRVATKIQCVNAFSSLRRSLSNRSLEEGLARSPSVLGGPIKRQNSWMGSQMTSIWHGLKQWTNKLKKSAQKRYTNLIEKCQGSNIKPPPPVPLSNAVRAFVGSFLSFLALYGLSALAGHDHEDRQVLAPFGALLTLLFSLTAAPASQPRTIIYGQLICISMALLGKHFLMDLASLPVWIVVPLIAAGGIALMTKLGLAHPPAAAVIVALFSQRDFSIVSGAFVLAGNLIAICVAVLVNNLSEKSQYPIYWGFGFQATMQSLAAHTTQMLLRRSSQEYIQVKTSPEESSSFSYGDRPSLGTHSYVPIHGHNHAGASGNLPVTQAEKCREEVSVSSFDFKSDEEEAMVYFSY